MCWHRLEVDAPSALGGAGGPLWTTLDPSLEYKEVAALLAVGAPLPTVSSPESGETGHGLGDVGTRVCRTGLLRGWGGAASFSVMNSVDLTEA